jgi:alkanesulfonate monooxygenase
MGGLQPLERMRKFAGDIRAAATNAGRSIRLQASARVILGDTEEAAWRRAQEVVEGVQANAEAQQRMRDEGGTATMPGMRIDDSLSTAKGGNGIQRNKAFVDGADILDKRLWTGATKASVTFSTPMIPPVLVGTPEQVADAMGDYYDLGITGFITSGFLPMRDIALIGQELTPLLRKMANARMPVR